MQANRFPASADLIVVIVAPLTAILGAVALTQADGDLAAHIRMGNQILETARIPSVSLVSFTAQASPLVDHAWLSEVLFALLFRAGGLPLICALTGIVIGLTHGGVALWLRRRGTDARWAVAAALFSLAIASIHWLARPHLFSIAAAAVTIWLLESRRPRRQLYFLPFFAIWANLHGGWLYGLVIIGMYVVGDLAEAMSSHGRDDWLIRARGDGNALLLAAAGCLINPFGTGLYREVISGATSTSLARNMSEFMPANFQEMSQAPFLLALMLTIAILALSRRRMPLPWLAVLLTSSFFALRSSRNIALFAVTGWPLVALHASGAFRGGRKFPLFNEFARIDAKTRVGWLAGPVCVLLLLLGLNRGAIGHVRLIADHFDSRAFPVGAVTRARQANLSGRVFETWRWAGYIMYAWPDASLHVDPLKFTDTTLDSYSIVEDLRPGWLAELGRWQVRTIIVAPGSPLARALATAPGWTLWYRDGTAVVFRAW